VSCKKSCRLREAAEEMLEAYNDLEDAKNDLLDAALRLEKALEEGGDADPPKDRQIRRND
jgi:outer membrane protein TolC